MPAKLTLYPGRGASRYFVFREGRNHFVGRDPASDILLEEPRVSGRHALFQWTGAGWILVDLRSKNGTFVNGARIAEIPLQEKDWVSFGGLLCRYERVSEERVETLLSERALRLQQLLEARERLDGDLECGALLSQLVESMLELTQAKRGFVLVLGSRGVLDAEVASGFSPFERIDERFEAGLAAIEEVLATEQPVLLASPRRDLSVGRRPSLAEMEMRPLACVPMHAGGHFIGLVFVEGRDSGGAFTDLDQETLEALADHVAVAIKDQRPDHPIREVLADPGTTLPAAGRGFLEELERRVGGFLRASGPVSGRLTP